MDFWIPILSSAITTLVGIIIADVALRIKTSRKKYVEQKQKEQDERTKEVVAPIISNIVNSAIAPLEQTVKDVKTDLEATRDVVEGIKKEDIAALRKANRDSLRNQLYDIYDRCIEYRTDTDIENEAEMFDSYKALGGNHGCDNRHEIFAKLPTEDKYFYSKRVKQNKEEK